MRRIVDDDRSVGNVQARLERHGFEIATAKRGWTSPLIPLHGQTPARVNAWPGSSDLSRELPASMGILRVWPAWSFGWNLLSIFPGSLMKAKGSRLLPKRNVST